MLVLFSYGGQLASHISAQCCLFLCEWSVYHQKQHSDAGLLMVNQNFGFTFRLSTTFTKYAMHRPILVIVLVQCYFNVMHLAECVLKVFLVGLISFYLIGLNNQNSIMLLLSLYMSSYYSYMDVFSIRHSYIWQLQAGHFVDDCILSSTTVNLEFVLFVLGFRFRRKI